MITNLVLALIIGIGLGAGSTYIPMFLERRRNYRRGTVRTKYRCPVCRKRNWPVNGPLQAMYIHSGQEHPEYPRNNDRYWEKYS